MNYFSRMVRQTGLQIGAAPRAAEPVRGRVARRATDPESADIVEVESVAEAPPVGGPARGESRDNRPSPAGVPPAVSAPVTDTPGRAAIEVSSSPGEILVRSLAEGAGEPAPRRLAPDPLVETPAETSPARTRDVLVPAPSPIDEAGGPRTHPEDIVRRVLAWIAEGHQGAPGPEAPPPTVASTGMQDIESPAPRSASVRTDDAPERPPVREPPPISITPVERIVERRPESAGPTLPRRPERRRREPVEDVVNLSIGTISVRVDAPKGESEPRGARRELPVERAAASPSTRATSSFSSSRLRRRYLRP